MKDNYLQELYDKENPNSIEKYAQKLIGHTFEEVKRWDLPSVVREDGIEEFYGNKSRKGGLGNLIEEQFFCYKANSDQEPDFKEAGVELKVTPYEVNKNGNLRAGERLVLTMISYEKPVEKDFLASHFWYKCQLILLIYYFRDKSLKNNLQYRIDFAKLFSPSAEDLEIIKQDYKTIIDKVAAGKADELSEGDTNYLGACTKGASAEKSTVTQKYYAPTIKARRRAFCFKNSYMTYVLNNYIVPNESEHEAIIKNPNELKKRTFEEIVNSRISLHIGETDKMLCEQYGRTYNGNKSQWIDLAYRMIGIKSNKAEEFQKAQIVVKAIRLDEKGRLRENSPLPSLRFTNIINEEWEESELFKYLNETRFLFVVFKLDSTKKEYKLKGCQLWNMPYRDLNSTVHDAWDSVKADIKKGVVLERVQQKDKIIIKNNLLKQSEKRIVHIRPHTQKAYYVLEDGAVYGNGTLADSDKLPDGRRITKQSFWLNNDYILSQLKADLR